MDHLLTADHCLSIAAAFIAVVAACATLISIANNKADSLAGRYREVTREYREKEHRKQSGDLKRCDQLQEQIRLFVKRFRKLRWTQYLLFSTIGSFIMAIGTFIYLGLRIIYSHIPDKDVPTIAQGPIIMIGSCIAFGALCMFVAIFLLFFELRDSAKTFQIETRDCLASTDSSSSTFFLFAELWDSSKTFHNETRDYFMSTASSSSTAVTTQSPQGVNSASGMTSNMG